MRLVLPIAVLLAATTTAAAEAPILKSQLEELEVSIDTSCRKTLNEKLARSRNQLPLPALAKWLDVIANTDEYCPCTAKRLVDNVTPELLKPEARPALIALANRAGVECSLPKFKETFPMFCRGMLTDIADHIGRREPAEPVAKEFCECVRPGVEAVSTETYIGFVSATLRDYATYQRSGELPPKEEFSLLAAMNRCGIREIRGKLQPK